MLRKTKEKTGVPLDLRALETFTEVKGHFNLTHLAFESGNKTEQHMGPRRNILPTACVIKEANCIFPGQPKP